MTKITIKPIGADEPKVTGRLVSRAVSHMYIAIAPGTSPIPFPTFEWEEVPHLFVFPTIPGAVIEHTTVDGAKFLFARHTGGWRTVETGTHYSTKELEAIHNGKFRVVFPGEGAEQ